MAESSKESPRIIRLEDVERMLARAYVIAGGAFWIIAAVAGEKFSHKAPIVGGTPVSALWPLLATIVALGIGWYYERLAAVLLIAGCCAVGVWGITSNWETGVWLIQLTVLVAPMLIGAVLFWLAARAHERREAAAQ